MMDCEYFVVVSGNCFPYYVSDVPLNDEIRQARRERLQKEGVTRFLGISGIQTPMYRPVPEAWMLWMLAVFHPST